MRLLRPVLVLLAIAIACVSLAGCASGATWEASANGKPRFYYFGSPG